MVSLFLRVYSFPRERVYRDVVQKRSLHIRICFDKFYSSTHQKCFSMNQLLRLNLISYRYMFRSSWDNHQAILYNTTKVNWTPNMIPYFGSTCPYYESYALSCNLRIILYIHLSPSHCIATAVYAIIYNFHVQGRKVYQAINHRKWETTSAYLYILKMEAMYS
jgi:hypothetical protein